MLLCLLWLLWPLRLHLLLLLLWQLQLLLLLWQLQLLLLLLLLWQLLLAARGQLICCSWLRRMLLPWWLLT